MVFGRSERVNIFFFWAQYWNCEKISVYCAVFFSAMPSGFLFGVELILCKGFSCISLLCNKCTFSSAVIMSSNDFQYSLSCIKKTFGKRKSLLPKVKIKIISSIKEEMIKVNFPEDHLTQRLLFADYNLRNHYFIYSPCLEYIFCVVCGFFRSSEPRKAEILSSDGYRPKTFSDANKYLKRHEKCKVHLDALDEFSNQLNVFDPAELDASLQELDLNTRQESKSVAVLMEVDSNRHIVETVISCVIHCVSAGMSA